MKMIKNMPAFASEKEEADWWYEHRDERADAFVKAAEEGRLQRGGMARRLQEAEKATNLILERADALKAAKLAIAKNIDVQVYLNRLLHEALARESEQAST